MPIPKAQVPSVDELSTHLGYYTKVKPYRQYDLTLSTKEWRNTYTSSDGIPGTEITDWASDKGNDDLKVMSRKFLESGYGNKHWPPGQYRLEYPRDREELLQLLHQLFWRQNLAAKNNQILKDRRESINQKAQSDSCEDPSEYLVGHTGVGFTAVNEQSSSPTEPNAYRCTHGDKADPAPSRSHRRPAATQVRYVDLDTESEEVDRQRKLSLIFKRRFMLKTEQYRHQIHTNYQAALPTTSLRPVADMRRKSMKSVTPPDSSPQKRFSSLEGCHPDNYPTTGEETISDEETIPDEDSESITPRRVMTRRRNISGPAKMYSADDKIKRLQRRPSTGTSSISRTAKRLGDGYPSQQNVIEAEAWIGLMSNDASKDFDEQHESNDDDSTRKGPLTRKRMLSGESFEPRMSNKKVRGTSSTEEHKQPSSPLTSVDMEHHLKEGNSSRPRTLSSGSIATAPSDVGRIHPSAVSTQVKNPSSFAALDRDGSVQTDPILNIQDHETRMSSPCQRCKRLHVKCNRLAPCNRCQASGYDCGYDDIAVAESCYLSSSERYSEQRSGMEETATCLASHSTASTSAATMEEDNQRPKRKSNRAESFCVRCHGKNTKSENEGLCKACKPKGSENPDDRHVAPVLTTPPLATRQRFSPPKKALSQARQVSEDSNANSFTEQRNDQGTGESSMAPPSKRGMARDQSPKDMSAAIPSSNALGPPTDTSNPRTTPSNSTTTTTQPPPPPNTNRKTKSVTKYYILAWDSSGPFQENFSSPSFSGMTIEDLFVQAATHVSGREISRIKFILSSTQPGFVGRRFTVEKGDNEKLEEVKEEFRLAQKDGVKKGITKFRVLLEPELEALAAAEDSDDVDEM